MDALELLKQDHDKVEQLFQKVKANEDGDNSALARQISDELTIHTHIEETVFYPRLIDDGDEELVKLVMEGIEEHRQVKQLLKEIGSLADGSESLMPKLQVVMEDTIHHVQEEEGEMFKMVREQFDESMLNEIGEELAEEKQTFKKSMSASAR